MSRTSSPVTLTLPAALHDAYRSAGDAVPPLSTLLTAAVRGALLRAGITPPPPEPPARTTAASAARWPRDRKNRTRTP